MKNEIELTEEETKAIKTHKRAIWIYAWCLILWIGKLVMEIVDKDYVSHPKILIADIVCLIFYNF